MHESYPSTSRACIIWFQLALSGRSIGREIIKLKLNHSKMDITYISNAKHWIKLIHLLMAFVLTLAIHTSYSAYANRVSDKIYNVLQSNHYCSRRLNATHQMGCTSELGGNFGVVWFVEDRSDITHLLEEGPTPPYIAILKREHYTRENLLKFKANPDRVTGVVFLSDDDSRARLKPFSPEDRCPNRYSGLYVNSTEYGECKKNLWLKESQISDLLYDDIPYPIFLINDEASIEKIESCFSNNNIVKNSQQKRKQDTYPLCSIQLDSFMLAASDTETCLNSRSMVDDLFQSSGHRCYTVDNYNVFAYFKPTNGSLHPTNISEHPMTPDIVEPQSVVLLVAKLSSLSMFTELSPGADSTIVPIVIMLAVAEALNKRRKDSEVARSNRNIAFALLDSEPFDYTGSSRMVYQMQNNSFPHKHYAPNDKSNFTVKNINIESLDYVINLDQLANYPNGSRIYLHSDPLSENTSKLNRALEIFTLAAAKQNVDFKTHDPELPLPPTSVHQFIKSSTRIDRASNRLLGLVLSNYDKTYENLFYNSIYDDTHNIYQTKPENLVKHISRVASFVADSIFELAFNQSVKTTEIVVNETLINEMLGCYLTNASCGLFTTALQASQKFPADPIQTYKDPTKRSDDMNGIITGNLLAYFVGDRIEGYNMTKCYQENEESRIYNYQYVNGKEEPIQDGNSGICIMSQVFLTHSTSPSFGREEDRITVDRNYPAWTVSLNSIRNPVRIFLKPSPVHQWCVFLLGVVVTVMSFITVYHLRGSISQLQVDSDPQQSTST